MKVVFLDVDGVLNYEGCGSYYGNIRLVKEDKIQLLAEVIKATKAKIVLTSTWRQGFWDLCEGRESFEVGLYEALEDALEKYDLHIFDCTGNNQTTRGEEIDAWMRKKGEIIESFVILDDMAEEEFGVYADYLVQTDICTGLEERHVKQVICMLNERVEEKAEENVMKKTEGILGTNDINYIYGLMNKLLCELEESEFYSYKPGTDEDGFEFYNMRLQNIRNEIDSRFCSKKDIRDKLYRLVEEEEELIKSYTQPGAPDRWMKANPRLRFYDCVFDFIEECPELYEQIRRGEVVTGIGEAMSFNFYPTEEECEARRRYFAELAEKSAKQNSGYSFERLYQNELVDTFRIIFEAEFA